MAKILIACEESQTTTKAFRKLGHEAYSCDLLPCSGGHPEWHFQQNVIEVMNGWFDCDKVVNDDNFEMKFDVFNDYQEYQYMDRDSTESGLIKEIGWNWDLMIAHPPCTFLTGSGVQWLSHPDDKHLPFDERRPNPKYPNRRKDMLDSIDFVKELYNAPIKHIAIENPVGLLSSKWKKPDQIVQPYMFGDEATKTTCLWLKNLPLLLPTNIVGKGERTVFSSGKSHPKWYADALKNARTKEERQTLRSKTFEGMAEAFAQQWSDYLKKQITK